MQDPIKILSDLIEIRTDNPSNGNNDIIQYIISYFEKEKISCVRIKNPNKNLFNLVAGININNFQDITNGILLSCHLDTVPASENEWKENPFKAQIINDCLFGRGSVDMKQSIAILLSILKELKNIKMPIFLCFTSDEETSCQGIKSILHFFKQKNIHPQYGIVLEPTNLKIGIKNKGFKGFQTKIIGKACHSSQPENGINALYIAARLVSFIEQTALLYQNSGLTLNVGVLNGGSGCNLVAPNATIDFEIRSDDNGKTNEVIKQIQAYHNALSKEYKETPVTLFELDNMPAFNGNIESKLIPAIQKEKPSSFVTSFDYATEAGFYQEYGVETVIFGPGDETLAHTNNEHIKINDLLDFQNTLFKIIQNLSETYQL
ncbi:MAG: M20/M25/M40 family metallo-hydrolase [Alphaproteobacteria bacterium]|nr:M20/M25/M40 family metallo-hydrolase [Alphaproteobacteria bacterium]